MASGLPEGLVLMDDPRPVERRLHVEHGLLGRLKDRVEPAQDRHRQDHVSVLASHVEIAEHVVRDPPDEAGDAYELMRCRGDDTARRVARGHRWNCRPKTSGFLLLYGGRRLPGPVFGNDP